jgi:cytochrome c biogenesis protein
MIAATKRYINKKILPTLGNLQLAIVLLLVIAVFSILGTVIEQGQAQAFYQTNYPEKPALFGFLTWKVLLATGLDHVYRTWWYLSLLILFGASLITCTFKRQLPALKWFSRTQKLYTNPKQFQKFALSSELDQASIDPFVELLTENKYKIIQDGDKVYARKGIAGRIGPIIVHASMIIILTGGIIGALTGFIAQESIASGNTFQISNIIDAGPWAAPQIPKDWAVKVNRFWIDYLPTGEIDQFYSDLSVLNEAGKEVDRKTIHVNEPLRYKGVTLYQADWSIAGIAVKFNNSPVLNIPISRLNIPNGRLWGTFLPIKPDGSYGSDGKLISTVRKGMSIDIKGVTITIVDVVGSTGLQIKADPGIPVVYLGFALMMVSVLMSYVSHSQVWGLYENGKLYLGGTTNRAQVTFEREFIGILDRLSSPKT